MKTILCMAMSADGFIAGQNDETPWNDDEWVAFQNFITSCDVVLLGRRTYEIMRSDGEFVDGPEYIVVSNNPSLDCGDFRKMSITSKSDLPQAQKIGVIGGGRLNGSLAQLGVFDEIILDIEPILLGTGHTLFGGQMVHLNLELLESRKIGPLTLQHHYKVKSYEA